MNIDERVYGYEPAASQLRELRAEIERLTLKAETKQYLVMQRDIDKNELCRYIERLREELDACGGCMRRADAEIARLRSELESTRDAIVVVARGKDTKIERLRGAIKQLKTSAYLDDWETFDKVIREALDNG